MGQAAPFRKGGFSQALFFPKQNAGVFRPLRRATRGSASGLRELLKKFDQNFNPVRAGYVCEGTVVRSVTYAGRSAGSSYLWTAQIPHKLRCISHFLRRICPESIDIPRGLCYNETEISRLIALFYGITEENNMNIGTLSYGGPDKLRISEPPDY